MEIRFCKLSEEKNSREIMEKGWLLIGLIEIFGLTI